MNNLFKQLLRQTLTRLRLEVKRVSAIPASVPDREFYFPTFRPWMGYGDFDHFRKMAEPFTLLSSDRLYILYGFALNALCLNGEFWECGVYKGGSARMLAHFLREKGQPDSVLRLFDTFGGMPETNPRLDLHHAGDFADTSFEAVCELIGDNDHVVYHPGLIPETFAGREGSMIAFAHIDLDIYQSVRDSCEFIYPRLTAGGVLIFDDYGFPSCPGARKAVDEFFLDRPESPVVLATGQAFVIKSFGGLSPRGPANGCDHERREKG